ncbi:YbcC family protein [Amorphus orientalis]|uniref:Probable inorganic carbon transporter subunit DabA n=1 Tax=Amorphus orientalis TaxID=649198 RepID=A0AAE4ARL1_9HYPH|nr:DUF2309 domain-containing protein [Amorphus orientalis]MDQ0314322.1 uncharacterized protein YbcC (UPF0753/DUF2309 family) [Amorphus orientalis]
MDGLTLIEAAEAAGRQIPPLWPLASSVAVNPFLGQAGLSLAETGARLGRAGGIPVTLPRTWFADKIAAGEITAEDLAAALAACRHADRPRSVEDLRARAGRNREVPAPPPTVADLAAQASGTDWPGLLENRFGAWAAGYLDEGQALWAAARDKSAWRTYRNHASHDLVPEIMGLTGFAVFVNDAPERPRDAIARAVDRLEMDAGALGTYFHRLLLSLGGWSQLARYRLWQAELDGGTDRTLFDFLAIRLLWEEALYARYEDEIAPDWAEARAAYAAPVTPDAEDVVDEILQEAAERAAQRTLAATLAAPARDRADGRPALQAAFCIDVRSEAFRRALESVDPGIRTIGFAGFFGISAEHRRFASDVEERHLPVLLTPGVTSSATGPDNEAADRAARIAARVKRAWGRFKLAAVASFAFVEAMGPVYAGRLVGDTFGLRHRKKGPDPAPRFAPELTVEDRVAMAETVLKAMSLTRGFARLVLLLGHGARVVNNPHASGLQCGACGGYAGDVNARLLAGLLNEQVVRDGLRERGISIPDDTLFVAGLHDTTTDAVTLFDLEGSVAADLHGDDLNRVRGWLSRAGLLTRSERALRLPGAHGPADIFGRARDWSEVRPEWGLAGCRAFIAAPRGRTVGRDLTGSVFLHDYDWKQDAETGFGVLELILTAPVVVASWISLQYYGSAVAPEAFGAGNKLLHNVVGGIGVVEGNGGALRGGLPWQSVHDGERFVHEPLRLTVCIEAPREAMSDILERHESVRALFDNRWLHLFALEEGQPAWRYEGDLAWTREPRHDGEAVTTASAVA